MLNMEYSLLKQLKDKHLSTLLLLEDKNLLLCVLPHKKYIRLTYFDVDNTSVALLEDDMISEAEKESAFYVFNDGFAKDLPKGYGIPDATRKVSSLNILSRHFYVEGENIHFVCHENIMTVDAFEIKLEQKLHHRLTYDMIANKFSYDFCKNYRDLEEFLLRNELDYLNAVTKDGACTSLWEEDTKVLGSIMPFLKSIGFDDVMTSKLMRFRSHWFGDRYAWTVLMKYLHLVSARGVRKNIADKVFALDTTAFTEYLYDSFRQSQVV